MRRREFITLLGGAAAAWPPAARAQQADRMRRIGIILPAAADDPEYQTRVAAFHQALALLGWTIGRNVRVDTRWATANAAEPMYAVLNDGAAVTNDNPDAALRTSWTQWNIDLQAFGVNLANVNTITIGLGNRANPVASGAGIMYFDDIRLYAQ